MAGMARHTESDDGKHVGKMICLSELMIDDVRTIAEDRGFTDDRILASWPEIVGPELGRITRPLEIRRGFRSGSGGRLFIETPGSCSQRVDMSRHEIIERVNSACGYKAVANVSIVQTSHAALASVMNNTPDRQVVTEEMMEKCRKLVADTDNEELRKELMKLCIQLQLSENQADQDQQEE